MSFNSGKEKIKKHKLFSSLNEQYIIYQIAYISLIILLAISLLATAVCLFILPNSDFKLLALFLSALTATITLIYNARRNVTEDALKEAKEYFSKSFLLLENKDDPKYAIVSKVRWASAVALIKVATSMEENIYGEASKQRYNAERNYWRLRFSEIIHMCSDSYYTDKSKSSSEWLSKDDVVIMCKFSRLIDSENYLDPYMSIAQHKKLERNINASGLISFLKKAN